MAKKKQEDENNEKDRDAFIRIKEQSEDDFEKYITYISAGGLALSLTFIEKIVPLNESISLWCMVLGWGFLSITLLVNLLSHFLSKRFANKSMEEYDNNDQNLSSNIDRRNCISDSINLGTIITLFLGIGFIVTFVTINAYNMADKGKKNDKPTIKKVEKFGRTISKPPSSSNGNHSNSQNDKKKK